MKLKKLLESITGYPQTAKKDDHEVDMALTDLRSIVHRASELVKRLEEDNIQELEGWIQAKITKSADYINAVYDNFMFEDDDSYHDDDDDCDDCDEREDLDESKSTCCGKCGRFHVKGTSCPKPFLTGKRHCRNRSK